MAEQDDIKKQEEDHAKKAADYSIQRICKILRMGFKTMIKNS